MRCCFQDLFKTAHSILVLFSSSFFSRRFLWIQVVYPYNSADRASLWKNACFILSERPYIHRVVNLSIAIYAFYLRILTSLVVGEILLPRYLKWSTNVSGLTLKVEMAPSCLKDVNSVLCETDVSCCLLLAKQQIFGLNRYICEKCSIISVVCIRDSFCWLSTASCDFFLVNYNKIISIRINLIAQPEY